MPELQRGGRQSGPRRLSLGTVDIQGGRPTRSTHSEPVRAVHTRPWAESERNATAPRAEVTAAGSQRARLSSGPWAKPGRPSKGLRLRSLSGLPVFGDVEDAGCIEQLGDLVLVVDSVGTVRGRVRTSVGEHEHRLPSETSHQFVAAPQRILKSFVRIVPVAGRRCSHAIQQLGDLRERSDVLDDVRLVVAVLAVQDRAHGADGPPRSWSAAVVTVACMLAVRSTTSMSPTSVPHLDAAHSGSSVRLAVCSKASGTLPGRNRPAQRMCCHSSPSLAAASARTRNWQWFTSHAPPG